MKHDQRAEFHGATSYLNSLLLEWPVAERLAAPAGINHAGEAFRIALLEGRFVWLPLAKFSLVGRHRYSGSFFAEENATFRPIGFTDLRTMITPAIAAYFKAKPADDFESRVLESTAIIARTLALREKDLSALYSGEAGFLAAEQGLALGHSFHPTPKSREGFSLEDLNRYSPEFGGAFRLAWYLVKPAALVEEKGASLANTSWLQDLFAAEVGAAEAAHVTEAGWIPLPAHPWQKEKVAGLKRIEALRSQGLLSDHDGGPKDWHPTSSLRTIYREGAPYMLKFSLSVRLTNSVRHITPAELRRGLQVHEVLSSAPAQSLTEEFPDFSILAEPAFAALADESGAPLIESIVVARDNPFAAKDPAIVVATLAQEAPLGGLSLLLANARKTGSASAWFAQFLTIAIEPFLVAEGELGIILGAHQQNLLLSTERGWPKKAYFRDCHGTGYTAKGVDRFLPSVPLLAEDNGNLVPARMGRVLFGYYLILNTVFNVIAGLSDTTAEEAALLGQLRDFLLAVRNRAGLDPAFIDYLTLSPKLLQKGNFACAWASVNENTTADPLAIYTEIPNPLFRGQA